MKLKDCLPDAAPYLPGCPTPMILRHLSDAAREFCRETHIWEEEIPPVYPVEGVTRYQLDLPEEAEILSVKSATQGDESPELSINVFGVLKLHQAPENTTKPIEVEAILQPVLGAEGIAGRILGDYREGIVQGALYRLLLMPNADWSNPELATLCQRRFRESVVDARTRKARGNTDRPMRVRPQPFL